MKTLYHTLTRGGITLITFLLVSLLTACVNEEEQNSSIIIADTEYQISATTVEKTIEFEAKGNWNVIIEYLNGEKTDKEKEWLQLEKNHGQSGKVKLILELKPNYTETPRRANLSINCNGEQKTLHIEQANVASGSGDEKAKRISALYAETYSGEGYREQWNRTEFKYDENGKLIRLFVGAGKINEDGTLEGDRYSYIYEYQEEAILTQEKFEGISYKGSYADMDLEHLQGNGNVEVYSYFITLNENGDATDVVSSGNNVQYVYNERRLTGITGSWGRAVEWDTDNMVSFESFYGTSTYRYSNYTNHYNIDLNRYIPYGLDVEFGYEVPSDYLGERSKNLLGISHTQFDKDGYLVSFSNNGNLTDIYIVYEPVE